MPAREKKTATRVSILGKKTRRIIVCRKRFRGFYHAHCRAVCHEHCPDCHEALRDVTVKLAVTLPRSLLRILLRLCQASCREFVVRLPQICHNFTALLAAQVAAKLPRS
jgi:hypothetical protein